MHKLMFIRVAWIVLLFVVWMKYRRVTYFGNIVMDSGISVDISHRNDDTVHTLYRLRERAIRLIDALESEYPKDEYVRKLKKRFTGSIHELEHGHINVFGYNRNKGDISVCLHNKQNVPNQFNDMFFVIMHEMSHLMTDTYEHDQTFQEQFKRMIQVATKHGIYTSVDYKKKPSSFCDGYIQHNP